MTQRAFELAAHIERSPFEEQAELHAVFDADTGSLLIMAPGLRPWLGRERLEALKTHVRRGGGSTERGDLAIDGVRVRFHGRAGSQADIAAADNIYRFDSPQGALLAFAAGWRLGDHFNLRAKLRGWYLEARVSNEASVALVIQMGWMSD